MNPFCILMDFDLQFNHFTALYYGVFFGTIFRLLFWFTLSFLCVHGLIFHRAQNFIIFAFKFPFQLNSSWYNRGEGEREKKSLKLWNLSHTQKGEINYRRSHENVFKNTLFFSKKNPRFDKIDFDYTLFSSCRRKISRNFLFLISFLFIAAGYVMWKIFTPLFLPFFSHRARGKKKSFLDLFFAINSTDSEIPEAARNPWERNGAGEGRKGHVMWAGTIFSLHKKIILELKSGGKSSYFSSSFLPLIFWKLTSLGNWVS